MNINKLGPPFMKSLSWLVYNSNFTMVYDTYNYCIHGVYCYRLGAHIEGPLILRSRPRESFGSTDALDASAQSLVTSTYRIDTLQDLRYYHLVI